MFTTTDLAHISHDDIFDYEDEKWWSFIQVPLFAPFFLVIYEIRDDNSDVFYRTYLLSNVRQLRAALLDRSMNVNEVQILTPSNVDGKHSWEMNPLGSIHTGRYENYPDGPEAIVYELRDGRRIVEAGASDTESKITALEQWFSIPSFD